MTFTNLLDKLLFFFILIVIDDFEVWFEGYSIYIHTIYFEQVS